MWPNIHFVAFLYGSMACAHSSVAKSPNQDFSRTSDYQVLVGNTNNHHADSDVPSEFVTCTWPLMHVRLFLILTFSANVSVAKSFIQEFSNHQLIRASRTHDSHVTWSPWKLFVPSTRNFVSVVWLLKQSVREKSSVYTFLSSV